MRDILMMKGAKILVDTCAAVVPDESVLVVTDMETIEVAKPLAAAAYERGAETVIAIMTPRAVDGQEPPRSIAAAMAQADVIFTPVKISITHTKAISDAMAAGARAIMLTAFIPDMLISGGIEADFASWKPTCEEVATRFGQAKTAHLTSTGGTDLTMDVTGRRGNAMPCMVVPGQFSAVPNIEATVAPVEGSAEGIIVADASIPYIGIGLLREPVRFTVEKGFITKIEGGDQARQLEAALQEFNDPNVYNIAELGVGLNPKCRMQGIMLEDEGVLGTVHIGIGSSFAGGGRVKAPLHYDLIMWEPTITLDGETIWEKGQVKVGTLGQ